CTSNLFFRWVRIGCEHTLHGHHETRRAVPTLGAAPIAVSLLYGSQTPVLTYALNSGNDLPFAASCQQSTGEHGYTIHQHRARAAGRVVTATLRAGQIEILAQYIEKELAGLDRHLAQPSVYLEFNQFLLHLVFFCGVQCFGSNIQLADWLLRPDLQICDLKSKIPFSIRSRSAQRTHAPSHPIAPLGNRLVGLHSHDGQSRHTPNALTRPRSRPSFSFVRDTAERRHHRVCSSPAQARDAHRAGTPLRHSPRTRESPSDSDR